jgi:hypothetical protein
MAVFWVLNNMVTRMKSLKKSLKRRLPIAPGVWYAFHFNGFYSGMMKGNETGGKMNGNQTTPPMLPKK